MKLLCLTILMLSYALFAQQSTRPEPVYLVVLKAPKRYKSHGTVNTNISGFITDNPKVQVSMVCDAVISSYDSHGNVGNKYPAYHSKPGQIKIRVREIGTDNWYEHTCKELQ